METYRLIKNDLKELEVPQVPSISGKVLSKLMEKKEEKKRDIIPFLIIVGVSILFTILIWRKR